MTHLLTRRLSFTEVLYWGCFFSSLGVFADLAAKVWEHQLLAFDAPILRWFHTILTPLFTALALTFTTMGSVYVLLIALLILVVLLWKRSRGSALFLLVSFCGAAALDVVAKALFARTRPELFTQLIPEHDFSFPSGHMVGATAFFLALYFLSRQIFPRWQSFVGGIGLLSTVGIGVSRLYLQVHYPSDVLAGWLLSVVWVLGANFWYGHSQLWRKV
jgi:membrane-associated phospholipid phosphatase